MLDARIRQLPTLGATHGNVSAACNRNRRFDRNWLRTRKIAAKDGYDLVIAADESEINRAAEELRTFGGSVEAVEADLATQTGVGQACQRREGLR